MINTRLAAARHRDVIVLAHGLPEMDGVDMILEAGKPTPDGGELR
jgi:DNA-binding response OmpR family regulator